MCEEVLSFIVCDIRNPQVSGGTNGYLGVKSTGIWQLK